MASANAERLELLLRSGRNASDPDVKLTLARLGKELRERLVAGSSSQSLEIFTSARQALVRLKGSAHLELRFNCAYDCAQYFYVGGHIAAALATADHLKELALQAQDQHLRRKAFGFCGIVFSDVGDVGQALSEYGAALAIARGIDDIEGESITLSNIGVTLLDGGLYRESLVFSEKVAAMAATDPRLLHRFSTAKANAAQALFYLGNHTEGLNAIRDAIDADPQPSDSITALKRALRECMYVQMALELGNLTLARERSLECTRYSRFNDSPRSRLVADVAWGLCEVYGGDVDRGLQALERAASCNEVGTWMRVDAFSALAKAYETIGNPERALAHLQSLIEFLRTTRENGIQALLAISDGTAQPIVATDDPSLVSLELREANLRTKIAVQDGIKTRMEMFERLAATADLKEEMSGEHGYRVAKLASLICAQLGWSRESSLSIELAARLHDIGKIAMPDRILMNSSKLKDAERRFMFAHTTIGAELLAKSNIPQLRMAEEIARYHHEWWSGEGYPAKLKGKRIPIHARIVALADVFDALTHGRPFAEPWSMDKAIDEIRSRRGTQFDPELTDLFLDLIARLRNEHQDLDEYLGRAGRNSPFLMARNKIRMMLAEERDHEKKATVEGNQTHH